MKPIKLSPGELAHLESLALEYGLSVVRPEPGVTERDCIALSIPCACCGGQLRSAISISAVGDRVAWSVYPLGNTLGARRVADGYSKSFAQAAEDAEGMLRHYLKTTPMDEVMEVWGPDIFDRVNLGAVADRELVRIMVARERGGVCVQPTEDGGAS